MTDDTDLRTHDWRPSALKAGGYDGVSKVVLKVHETWSDPNGREAASLVLRRAIGDLQTGTELRIELADLERRRRLRPAPGPPFLHLCRLVAMILCGDIRRQTIRLNECQTDKRITLDFDASGLPEELREAASGWVEGRLKELAPTAGPVEDGHFEAETA